MKILSNNIRALIYNPDKFVKDHPKNAILCSTTLKIVSFVILMLKGIHPAFFVIAPVSLFSISLFIDYKILWNIDHLTILSVKNNDPYKCGYYFGRILAIIIKNGFYQRVRGFYHGFKKECLS